MPISKIVIGNLKQVTHPDTLKAVVAEFISMLIYVFADEGFAASSRLTSVDLQAQLIATVINHAFALVAVVSVAMNISGGHINPAVTFGGFLGAPCSAVVFEIVTTFGLVYAVYGTSIDPKRSNSGMIISPIAIGFIVGANILSGGAFCGATMNPAAIFGQAMVS
ncbi:hypothetical protein RND71_028451 [Anisodus tanguticus]|uniref:Uncharacterized protein n=1 Tax=Anisodus tanguticus TaxID=243964 RepID=A0AAE1RJP0_9SOLA|nr:hypothetical protein RND71_028451 [Anisodus tanguticus]